MGNCDRFRLGKIIFTDTIIEEKYIDLIRKSVPNFEEVKI
jgi:hypothetical protein